MADCPSVMQYSANLEGEVVQSQKPRAGMLLILSPIEQAEEGVMNTEAFCEDV